MKKVFALLTLCSFFLVLFISPYMALSQISDAIKTGNDNKFYSFLDMPSIKSNVTDRVKRQVLEKNPTIAQGEGIVNKAQRLILLNSINYSVDWLLTADNIHLFFKQAQLNKKEETNDLKMTYSYIGFNRFSVNYQINGNDNHIVLERHNLIFWKISDIIFPIDPDIFKSVSPKKNMFTP